MDTMHIGIVNCRRTIYNNERKRFFLFLAKYFSTCVSQHTGLLGKSGVLCALNICNQVRSMFYELHKTYFMQYSKLCDL